MDKFLSNKFGKKNKDIAKHIKRKETALTKLKSFFVRIGFEISNEENQKNWKEIIPLCSLIELLNIGNYLIEQSIDENNNKKRVLRKKIET